MELEVLEVWEQTDEIQDLSGRALGLFRGEEPERWRETAEEPFNFRYEFGYLEIIYSEFLEAREGGKATHGTHAEPSGGEFIVIPQADPKSLDKRKQTEIV